MLLEDIETQTPARKTLKRCSKKWHLPDSTLRTCWNITRDHRARLVWTNRDFFAYYNYLLTSLHFWNSLDVYTRGILGCLLGFWPLGQNPAGAKIWIFTAMDIFLLTSQSGQIIFYVNSIEIKVYCIIKQNHQEPLQRVVLVDSLSFRLFPVVRISPFIKNILACWRFSIFSSPAQSMIPERLLGESRCWSLWNVLFVSFLWWKSYLIGPLQDPVTWYGIMLGSKLRSGTFKTKESRAGLERVPLFWKSHFVTCVPASLIPNHVTGFCKGPIFEKLFKQTISFQNDRSRRWWGYRNSSTVRGGIMISIDAL